MLQKIWEVLPTPTAAVCQYHSTSSHLVLIVIKNIIIKAGDTSLTAVDIYWLLSL